MKKEYSKPSVRAILIATGNLLQGTNVFTDNPQKPSYALSHRNDNLTDDDYYDFDNDM